MSKPSPILEEFKLRTEEARIEREITTATAHQLITNARQMLKNGRTVREGCRAGRAPGAVVR